MKEEEFHRVKVVCENETLKFVENQNEMNLNEIATAKSNFVTLAVDDELVLVPIHSCGARMTEIFNLNKIQEGVTKETLTEKIFSEYEVASTVAQADVEEFLKDRSIFILND